METRPQNQQQKATKGIFHSHFHLFPSTLDIKSNENQKEHQRAMKSNEKQQKLQRATKSKNGHRGWKNQSGRKKHRKSKLKKALLIVWQIKKGTE